MSDALNKRYEISDEIGRGRFGIVYKCTSKTTGDTFAVKSIEKSLTSGDSLDAQCLLSEPKILKHLSPHPNIIQLHNLYEDETFLHMVIDLCSQQDLHTLINSTGKLSESDARGVFIQIMKAISHCHKHNVFHRDIKPDNILIDCRNVVKLADFGSAEVSDERLAGVVGTPYYVAPEVLSGKEYCNKVDIWSAGAVLYTMLSGSPPFNGDSVVEIFEAVLRANLRFPAKYFPGGVSSAVKDLLRKMLCKDVSKRFSAEQVLRHPWVTNG